MMKYARIHIACLATGAASLAGCASLPADRGYSTTADIVHERIGAKPQWSYEPRASDAAAAPPSPLTADQAVEWALLHNPRTREIEAQLGLSRADLENARRISNPSLGYSDLDERDGDGSQITRSVTLGVTDLLMYTARKRLAGGELDRHVHLAAEELLRLASDVEAAWYEAVSAAQVATLRESIAKSAEQSAELAQRFVDAGNVGQLQYERERAAAAEARIAATRAAAEATRTRSELAGLMGVASAIDWKTVDELPAPVAVQFDENALVQAALEQRLDLAAAHRAVSLREDALGVTRRWRWLGAVEVGYEDESDVDGTVLRGPTFAIELPIFNQGQGAVAAARAELLEARARLDTLALGVDREARLGVATLESAYDVAEQYRTALIPRREAIVARTQEQVNFMLLGVFDLLTAKRDEYDAYQGYVEAVRDYWIAHTRLRAVVGGRLPADEHGDTP